MGYLLFVFAKDVAPLGEGIMTRLRIRDLDCLTYQQKLRLARLGSVIVNELSEMASSATAVVVIASEKLHTDFHATMLIEDAADHGNLVSVIPENFGRIDITPKFFFGTALLRVNTDLDAFVDELASTIEKNLVNPR